MIPFLGVGSLFRTAAAPVALVCGMASATAAVAAPDIAVRPVVPVGMPDPQAAPEDAYRAGKAALAKGDARAALAYFRSALRRDPAYVAALSGAGVALDQLGRHDLARPYFEAALASQPDAPDLMYNLGLSLSMSGYTDRARALLVRAAARGNDDVKERSTTLLASLDGAMAPSRAVQRADTQAAPVVQASVPAVSAAPAVSDVSLADAVSRDVAPVAVAASQARPADTAAGLPDTVAAAMLAAPPEPAAVAIWLEQGNEPVTLATAAPLAEPFTATAPLANAGSAARDPLQPVILASAPPAAQLKRTDAGEWRLDVPAEPELPAGVAVATVALPPQRVIPDMPPLAPVAVTARLAVIPVAAPTAALRRTRVTASPAPAAAAPPAAVVAAPTARLAGIPAAVAAPSGGLDRLAAALSAMMPAADGPGLAGLPDGLVPLLPIAAGRRRRRPVAA